MQRNVGAQVTESRFRILGPKFANEEDFDQHHAHGKFLIISLNFVLCFRSTLRLSNVSLIPLNFREKN